jgi:hypothetical protein
MAYEVVGLSGDPGGSLVAILRGFFAPVFGGGSRCDGGRCSAQSSNSRYSQPTLLGDNTRGRGNTS